MLENFVAARAVFGMSLSFHIMFASLGVVVPFMLLVSQYLYLRRKNPIYLALNKKLTMAFAIKSRPVAPLPAPPSRRELRLG